VLVMVHRCLPSLARSSPRRRASAPVGRSTWELVR
jgi:hypothetical protein